MLWNVVKKEDCTIYINNVIDLKMKVKQVNQIDEVYMNYKGFNLTVPMLIWEFGEDLNLVSIENVGIEGESPFDKYFVIDHKDREKFLEEIYFFLVDNNMESVFSDLYRVNWE